MSSDLPIKLREGTRDDFGFIVSSWRETFASNSGVGLVVPNDRREPALRADSTHLHEELTRLINRILPRSQVRIACDEQDPTSLVGFAVYDGPELHFIYIRRDFRQQGIARMLLDGLRIKRFTFATLHGERRLRPRDRGWAFTPRWTF